MGYKIPCGQNIGHGDYCTTGRLCGACREIQRLNEELARARTALELSERAYQMAIALAGA